MLIERSEAVMNSHEPFNVICDRSSTEEKKYHLSHSSFMKNSAKQQFYLLILQDVTKVLDSLRSSINLPILSKN